VLPANEERLLARLSEDDLVLDVGGGRSPLTRADWVIDRLPYAAAEPPQGARFTAATWVERDICDREPWPFDDGQFDFVVCSHVLEDVRDPVYACSELVRVARAGYLEVPSRLQEQSWGVVGPWVGWSHHRWLVDVEAGRVEFVHKPHGIHGRESAHFAPGFHDGLTAEDKVQALWWEGSFEFGERMLTSREEAGAYLAAPVEQHGGVRRGWALRRRLARLVSGG
jgi:Methyltransferase domain